MRKILTPFEFLLAHVLAWFDDEAELLGILFFSVAVGFALSNAFWGVAAYFGLWVVMRSFVVVGDRLDFIARVIRDNIRHVGVRVETLPEVRVRNDGS